VVDNASTDGTREYLKKAASEHNNLKYIFNEENLGFAAGNNIGIKSTEADHYVLLNSDTIVTDQWLDKMAGFLEKNREIGMIGPVSNSVGNEQLINIEPEDTGEIIKRGLEWAEKYSDDFIYTSMLGFFCVMIRKDVIEKVGLLDEQYAFGMFEDDDYCLRVVNADYKLACHEGVFVYHRGSVGFKKMSDEGFKKLRKENMARFENKFNVKWTSKYNTLTFLNAVRQYMEKIDKSNVNNMKDKIYNRLSIINRFDFAALWESAVEKDDALHERSLLIEEINKALREKDDALHERSLLIEEINKALREKDDALHERASAIAERDSRINGLEHEVAETKRAVAIKDSQLYDKINELNRVYHSDFWKVASLYYRLRNDAPIISTLFKVVKVLKNEGLVECLRRIKSKLFTKVPASKEGQERLMPYDYNPYADIRQLKDIPVTVINKDYDAKNISTKFSLITTIFNESKNIVEFMESIEKQTLKPDELIIVDGGSTDDTVSLIEDFTKNTALNLRLIKPGRINIAAGRNVGIKECSNEIIVFTDAGCKLHDDFCKNLVGVFDEHDDADMVGGIYYPLKQNKYTCNFIPDFTNYTKWDTFLPSSRAIAVKKSICEKIGGYPEYLTLTGEDTLFDLNYRRASEKWYFSTKSFVYWSAPEDKEQSDRLAHSYIKGDGESGYGDFRFYDMFIDYKRNGRLPDRDIYKKQLEGFIDGRAKRSEIEIKKRKINGLVVILAGVPFADIGGGQRGTQLGLEFARNNYKVIFVNLYPSFGVKQDPIFFDIDYSLFEFYYINDFDIDETVERYKDILNKSMFIMEFPHPLFVPIIDHVRKKSKSAKIVYDYIDNWDSSLGGEWYTTETEQAIVKKSNRLLVSAKTLQDDLKLKTDKKSYLVPNSVNSHLFAPDKTHPRPDDLPNGKPVVLYVGSLYGDWFDWEVTEHSIKILDEFNFVFIGDYVHVPKANELNEKYGNAIFLGIKPQTSLPAYLTYSDVCTIQFKADHHISKYVNPLKIYEYLAMLKPVVATDMEELEGIPYIFISNDNDEFCRHLKDSINLDIDRDRIDNYISENNWGKRVSDIIDFTFNDSKR
jgi:GT2 family glycosyltransferase